jgi:hypothetical protein
MSLDGDRKPSSPIFAPQLEQNFSSSAMVAPQREQKAIGLSSLVF